MNIDILVQSFKYYPKGSLLLLISVLNLIWVFFIFFSKKNYKNKIFRVYFFYAFFALFWVFSNAYFQSKALYLFGESTAKAFAIIANITSSFAIIGFFCLALVVKHSKNKISKINWGIILFLVVVTLLFNLIPNLTVQSVRIFPELLMDRGFELVLGKWNAVYFLIGSIALTAAFINFILAIKHAKDRIKNTKFLYILFGMSLMYGSLIIFHIVLPEIFNNYKYVWLPPFLSIVHILIISYAMISRRFIDIRLLISRIIKLSLAIAISFSIAYFSVASLMTVFLDTPIYIWYFIFGGIAMMLFNKSIKLLSSRGLYNYVSSTEAEHLKYIANDLKTKKLIYSTVEECEKDIQKSFQNKLKSVKPQIVTLNSKIKRKYPKLINYFKKNKGILVTEEVKFTGDKNDKIVPFLKELESLGGICIPLFHASKGLMGLFTLGEKSYNHMYSKEEIAALEDIGSYLSFILTGIIYNNELESDVAAKTIKLKNQIQKINEVIFQQSDFIAMTAHELRTPLTIAMFQLDEIMKTNKDTKNTAEDLKVIDASLDHLKKLTQKLFDVQRYDLDKMEVNKEKTDIKKFLNEMFAEFSVFMKDKSLKFAFEDELKDGTICNVDMAQMRQIFSNLLTNSSKFTKKNGTIILHAKKSRGKLLVKISDDGKGVPDELKRSIFDKFKSGSNGSGIGLGLYICKKIIELHKGRIWVEDSDLGGASFCVELACK